MIERAKLYAEAAHAGQKYGPSDKPYTYHLEQVVNVLKRFGINDPEILAAGWLHDAIEDTDTTAENLRFLFGSRIADLVDAVTDGPGQTRELRKARPYRLIPQCPGAVALKLADRIANLEASIDEGHTRLLGRYAREHEGLLEAIYDGTCLPMWRHLASLFKKNGCGNVGIIVVLADPLEGEPKR